MGLVVLAALAATAGCGSPAPNSSPPAPPGAGQKDPCTLLSSVQLRQLRFSHGERQQAADELGGVSCVWSGYPLAQGPQYTARLIQGPAPGGMPSASINNLPTVQYTPPGADPRTHCGFLITVTPHQKLLVQFADVKRGVPGISHQVACQKAQAAASDMASTFSALPA
jgi:hypothetical protein